MGLALKMCTCLFLVIKLLVFFAFPLEQLCKYFGGFVFPGAEPCGLYKGICLSLLSVVIMSVCQTAAIGTINVSVRYGKLQGGGVGWGALVNALTLFHQWGIKKQVPKDEYFCVHSGKDSTNNFC